MTGVACCGALIASRNQKTAFETARAPCLALFASICRCHCSSVTSKRRRQSLPASGRALDQPFDRDRKFARWSETRSFNAKCRASRRASMCAGGSTSRRRQSTSSQRRHLMVRLVPKLQCRASGCVGSSMLALAAHRGLAPRAPTWRRSASRSSAARRRVLAVAGRVCRWPWRPNWTSAGQVCSSSARACPQI